MTILFQDLLSSRKLLNELFKKIPASLTQNMKEEIFFMRFLWVSFSQNLNINSSAQEKIQFSCESYFE